MLAGKSADSYNNIEVGTPMELGAFALTVMVLFYFLLWYRTSLVVHRQVIMNNLGECVWYIPADSIFSLASTTSGKP